MRFGALVATELAHNNGTDFVEAAKAVIMQEIFFSRTESYTE